MGLKKASKIVKKKMRELQKRKKDMAIFHDKKSTRNSYDSLYLDFIQRYVNAYGKFLEDLANAKTKETDGRSSKRTKYKWQTLKSLDFTKFPFISTSETEEHAAKYATMIQYYGKNMQLLTPEYQLDGHPRFPYLGIVYVILHLSNDNELNSENSSRILELKRNKLIDINLCRRGAQRERIFIGDIDASHIPIAIVIRVPNFSREYKKLYLDKYDLDECSFNSFKKQLSKSKNRLDVEKQIIWHIINFQTKKILEIAKLLAKVKGGKIVYLGSSSSEPSSNPPNLKDFKDQ